MDVLLPPSTAASVRTALVNDPAIDSMVVDMALAMDPGDFVVGVFADSRYAAVYRAPHAFNPGDFVVLGGFADPDVANFALLNRRAVHPDDFVGVDDVVDKLFAKYLADHPVPR